MGSSFFGFDPRGPGLDSDDVLDFEDTYDGLGDTLDESNDAFNSDTFGADVTSGMRDFDFSGHTADASEAIDNDQATFAAEPQRRTTLAAPSSFAMRTSPGEVETVQIPDLAPMDSIWGPSVKQPVPAPRSAEPTAMTFGHVTDPSTRHDPVQEQKRGLTLEEVEAQIFARQQAPTLPAMPPGFGIGKPPTQVPTGPAGWAGPAAPAPSFDTILQHEQQQQHQQHLQQQQQQQQQPARKYLSPEEQMRLSDRANKLAAMAKYNGLMTPYDKQLVARIQLSRLVSEAPESDDFYYHVYFAVRGRRATPQQELNQAAQTYLSQTSQPFGRRRNDNPLFKVQQQVQRIVAQARERPHPRGDIQLEGTLGKVAAHNVRAPKRTLQVTTPSEAKASTKRALEFKVRKNILATVEQIYMSILDYEQRLMQEPKGEDQEGEAYMAWRAAISKEMEDVWSSLRVMDVPDAESHDVHPFIALLNLFKGKKLIPRVFRHLDEQKKLAILTMVVAHLDTLDVVRDGAPDPSSGTLEAGVKFEIDVFLRTVLPPLMSLIAEASLGIVTGLVGIILDRSDLLHLVRTKVGLSFLTVLISRAEMLRQPGDAAVAEDERAAWTAMFDRLFNSLRGHFNDVFPPPAATAMQDEQYPWQFLAACAATSSSQQQHSLVVEVRGKVLDNVVHARKVPDELANVKIGNVNLFLNAMGLDASQLG